MNLVSLEDLIAPAVSMQAKVSDVRLLPSISLKRTDSGRHWREEVLARLLRAPWRPWLLNVTVHDGVVDLWGIANSKEEKLAAGVAVENAPGVALVNNHVIVRPHNWAEAKPYFTEADET